MTVTGKDKIEIIEKDPEGEEGRIKVNLSFLQMCHDVKVAVCPECGHTEMYLEDLTKLK